MIRRFIGLVREFNLVDVALLLLLILAVHSCIARGAEQPLAIIKDGEVIPPAMNCLGADSNGRLSAQLQLCAVVDTSETCRVGEYFVSTPHGTLACVNAKTKEMNPTCDGPFSGRCAEPAPTGNEMSRIPHCVQVGDLVTCDNVAQPVASNMCANAAGQRVVCPPGPDRSWHVLVVTYGGTVSLIKDLTKREAEFISKRLLGQPVDSKEERERLAAHEECLRENARAKAHPSQPFLIMDCNNVLTAYSAGTIISAEVFQ